MPVIYLNETTHAQVHALLANDNWCVACLCAAWCDACTSFRLNFEALAARHADKTMLWIDIEDEAELVGDVDIENFPTLLIQRGAQVTFFGTIEPNDKVAHRLIEAQVKAWHDIDPRNTACITNPMSNLDLRARLAALRLTNRS